MPQINFAEKEIACKLVYYGPGFSGKTTNLQYINRRLSPSRRSELISIATEGDRTLFFDFLPLKAMVINDFTIRFQVYTTPGQQYYNATRKLVLRGVDGIVFVADSQWSRQKDNIESFRNMMDNLEENELSLLDIPYVLQYNKRDLPNIAGVEYMDFLLNRRPRRVPRFESIATEGKGVFDTLNEISRLVITKLLKESIV